MRRRSRAGGEPTKTQRRKTVTLKRRTAPKAVRRRSSSAGSLHKQVALLTRERDEALARQAATADILRVISQSPSDLAARFRQHRLHGRAAAPLRFGVCTSLRRCYLFTCGRSLAGRPARGRRAHQFADRSQCQFSLTRDPRQKNAAPAGLVVHRPARTRTENPRDVRRELGAVLAAASRGRVHRPAHAGGKTTQYFRGR